MNPGLSDFKISYSLCCDPRSLKNGCLPGRDRCFFPRKIRKNTGKLIFIQCLFCAQVAPVIKEPAFQCRRHRFHPWIAKSPWRRAWQPTPVFLPREYHGQRSLVGYSLWGHRESNMTEAHVQNSVLLACMHRTGCPSLCTDFCKNKGQQTSFLSSTSVSVCVWARTFI